MRPVESEALVDHAGDEAGCSLACRAAQHGPEENGLPAIRIADPLIEYQRGAEIFEIGDVGQESIRQEIVNGSAARIPRITGTEVPAGLDFDAPGPQREVHIRVVGQKVW